MTRTELESELMEWIGELPKEEYTSALIIARFKGNGDKVTGVSGFTGNEEEFGKCLAELLAFGHAKGYINKTIKVTE